MDPNKPQIKKIINTSNIDKFSLTPTNRPVPVFEKEKTLAEKFMDLRGFTGKNLNDINFSNFSTEDLETCSFDTQTVWPNKLPDSIKPKDIIEKGKNPGLGIRELHERGITGKGVNVAIIDQKLLTDHEEYKDNLVFYEENKSMENIRPEFHGVAMSSLLIGKNCGVAPGSKLHYFAAENRQGVGNYLENSRLALEKIISKNETLPKREKVRLVSISTALLQRQDKGQNLEEEKIMKESIMRAENAGINVIFMGHIKETDGDFYFGKVGNNTEDKNDTDCYEIDLYSKETGEEPTTEQKERNVYIPTEYRTKASFTGKNEYCYSGKGGGSSAAPYLVGVMALALQINPDLKKKEILEKIKLTSVTNKAGLRIINPKGLIELLEAEKGQKQTK
ncbi:MAG: S8 family serine peptidase [bacterium]